jgi:hypothetical protein
MSLFKRRWGYATDVGRCLRTVGNPHEASVWSRHLPKHVGGHLRCRRCGVGLSRKSLAV